MSFKRNDVQEYIEYKCGCTDISKWSSYKQRLCNLTLSNDDISLLNSKSLIDAISYWSKALHSFIQALEGIRSGCSAWSIVKLYYTTFYCLRSELFFNTILIVRNGCLFSIDLTQDHKFTELHYKSRGDHQLTITHYFKLVTNGRLTDFISSNNIDDDIPYIWMLKERERVNYHMQSFPDPEIDYLDKKVLSIHQSK